MGIEDRKKREKKMLEEMRVQQIQNAAEEVFIRKGFNSATIEEIAKKAELSPATIYLYFKNKDELYASLNLITLTYLYTQIEAVYANRSLSCEEKIIGFKDALYKTYQYRPIILKIIFHLQLNEGLLSLSEELLDKLNGLSQLIMEMIAAVYKEGVEKGIFIPGHKNAHADILWAVFTGLILWEDAKKQLNPKKDFLKPTLDRAFDIFLRGIKVS
ncbi:MAG: TetR/AcrR family transcriptional regulator [Deltaproteobacteria bacterium]|nr:TetR/AcrR family transcriptional regulator [Deltaproteobacteria bacterium]